MLAHKFVFIGGLHRSGTSVLSQSLGEHPQISGFGNTGVPEDEGQHLQTVYPRVGHSGTFGFSPRSHLTENSPLVTEENRRKLFCQWQPYWDTEKPVLLEKSPPNLTRTRFLQALLPNSYFIIMVRHPVAAAYATQKWSHTSLYSLIDHWLHCYGLFEQDRAHLQHVAVLRYEDFVSDPETHLRWLHRLLGLEHHTASLRIRSDLNRNYFQKWEAARKRFLSRAYIDYLTSHFEERLNRFNYSLQHLVAVDTAKTPEHSSGGRNLLGRLLSRVHRTAGFLNHLAFRSYKTLRKSTRTHVGLKPPISKRSAVY